jgi:hypothetical protein
MCEDDKKCDCTCDDVNEKIKKFAQESHEHGLTCGNEIANVAKEIHPNALAIVPLYRSCIVIEQNKEENEKGIAIIHAYGDPHWLGGEIDLENLKSGRFHQEFYVQGDREGPSIVNKIHLEDDQIDDNMFIENDEN